MAEIVLKRFITGPRYTLGVMEFGGKKFFVLEPPWRNNRRNESCIPDGEYIVELDSTGRWKYARVLDVPERTAIEFHPGNTVKNTQGCLMPGYMFNMRDDFMSVSTEATEDFRELLVQNGGRAKLKIVSAKWGKHLF